MPGCGRGSDGRGRLTSIGSWLTARVLVVGALGAVGGDRVEGHRDLARHAHPAGRAARLGRALLQRHRRASATAGSTPQTRRFFPLLPALTWLFGCGGHATGVVLLVLVNVLAFGYGVAFIRLARFEGMSEETARKAVWLLALAPPAFVMVMGYTEALAGLLAVITFYGMRSGRWWLAAVAGLLSGLCRPPGVLLVAPIAHRGLALARGRRSRGCRGIAAVDGARARSDRVSELHRHSLRRFLPAAFGAAATRNCTAS